MGHSIFCAHLGLHSQSLVMVSVTVSKIRVVFIEPGVDNVIGYPSISTKLLLMSHVVHANFKLL